eukprot:16441981-Heterocapsa_arctica.AAC.1
MSDTRTTNHCALRNDFVVHNDFTDVHKDLVMSSCLHDENNKTIATPDAKSRRLTGENNLRQVRLGEDGDAHFMTTLY